MAAATAAAAAVERDPRHEDEDVQHGQPPMGDKLDETDAIREDHTVVA